MEKICRMLYKHGDLADWIAFEVYQRKESPRNECYEAYWMSPLNEVLFYESDQRLDALARNWARAWSNWGITSSSGEPTLAHQTRVIGERRFDEDYGPESPLRVTVLLALSGAKNPVHYGPGIIRRRSGTPL